MPVTLSIKIPDVLQVYVEPKRQAGVSNTNYNAYLTERPILPTIHTGTAIILANIGILRSLDIFI